MARATWLKYIIYNSLLAKIRCRHELNKLISVKKFRWKESLAYVWGFKIAYRYILMFALYNSRSIKHPVKIKLIPSRVKWSITLSIFFVSFSFITLAIKFPIKKNEALYELIQAYLHYFLVDYCPQLRCVTTDRPLYSHLLSSGNCLYWSPKEVLMALHMRWFFQASHSPVFHAA